MKQMTDAEVLAEALRHTTGNRREIEVSKYAGCVSCCAVFRATFEQGACLAVKKARPTKELERATCCKLVANRSNVKAIQGWRDEWETPEKRDRARRWTAKCPRCGEPAVIGGSTGLLDDQAYLPVVNDILGRQPAVKRQAFREGREG